MTEKEEEYKWCEDCDAYRHTRIKRWESSIAIILDEECVRCGKIFSREVKAKLKESIYQFNCK